MNSGAVRLSWAHASDIGMRATNQDAMGAARNGALTCFVVADGTGGHHGGEVASRLVVDALLGAFGAAPAFGAPALLSYVGKSIDSVAQARAADAQLADMSSTVAALLVDEQAARAVWAHLGDTRVYHFRAGRVLAVTKDHSLTQQLIEAGYASADQLRIHPQRHILVAAVGAEGDTPVAASEDTVALAPGDALLVCSDGLWEWVHEHEMEQALAASARSEDWLAAMCATADAAVAAAGKARDNYSVYAIRVHQQEAAT
ncbi:MAG: protein phosphatase 2C domain-containing protein [Pseudomonadota bacterium]